MKVNIFDAKNRLSELVQRAAAGEEVIITNRGKPVVKLVKADERGDHDPALTDLERRFAKYFAEMDCIPDRPDSHDPFEWNAIGLDR